MRAKIRRVKVIQPFPGYEIDDILVLNEPKGIFEYAYRDGDAESAFNAIFDELSTHHGTIAKSTVEKYLGRYFEDNTEYVMKSKEEFQKRIEGWKEIIETGDLNEQGVQFYSALIDELNWGLGKRA